jgi:hypothetical protein
MVIAPKKPAERVQFYRNKTSATGAWKTNATGIGSTALTIDALNALAEAAQAALDEQAAARAASKTATSNARQAVAAMSEAGADVIAAIKAKVASTGPSVWTLADLPEPLPPSPVPAPGTPTNFTAQLVQNGAVKIAWDCSNPSSAKGTVYEVQRKVGTGAWTILGTTGKRSFDDQTLTAAALASGSVAYQVTAIRSTLSGAPGVFLVQFGLGGGGELTATVVAGGAGAPKLAA